MNNRSAEKMKVNELRIGNWVYSEGLGYGQVAELQDYNKEIGIKTPEFSHFVYSDRECEPIPLTPEILEKAGFKAMPHYTVTGTMNLELGRGRFLSVCCVGTPNEMVFVSEEDAPEVKNLICARNFDYDGKTYIHHIQNLYFALTGTELNIQL